MDHDLAWAMVADRLAGTTRDLGPDRTAAVDLVLRTLRERAGGVSDPARVVVGRPTS